jgi:diadenosine tetraphosphate (Ap4A) HIT family hydrolase
MHYSLLIASSICLVSAVTNSIPVRSISQHRMMISNFFSSSSSSPPTPIKGVTYAEDGSVTSCIFCNIVNRTESGKIVAENDELIAFRTIVPMTRHHLLVCPKAHIKNSGSLISLSDADLIERMQKFGSDTIDTLLPTPVTKRFCFHVPPFNSIDHLHLHCIAQPETMSWLGHIKYYDQSFYCYSSERVVNFLRENNKSQGSG